MKIEIMIAIKMTARPRHRSHSALAPNAGADRPPTVGKGRLRKSSTNHPRPSIPRRVGGSVGRLVRPCAGCPANYVVNFAVNYLAPPTIS